MPVGIVHLFWELMCAESDFLPTVLFAILMLLSALLLFFLSGFALLFAGIAVGNESLRVRDALGCAFSAARGNILTIARFSFRSVLWLLLGIATIGVVQLLYFSHFYNLSYLRLCMALCPKEDNIQ